MSEELTTGAVLPLLLALAVGLVLGWLLARSGAAARSARAQTEVALARASRDQAHAEAAELRLELDGVSSREDQDSRTAAELAPLRAALDRVEQQVRTLERDRVEHFGQVGEHLDQVATQTRALREQTAALSGACPRPGPGAPGARCSCAG
ncbi:hypothetical protein [Serinicoccus sp. CUA-874]|uniref:hypothetical protein n=1 Tax=Serinicoccus sp. CUA-874 TaxID=1517939 RepID=UPI001EDC5637|nr:hypothetical protein [Serinicoccus sp. CUA-874]